MDLLTIRRYEPLDYEAVWNLHNIALAATGSFVGNGWWDKDLHNIPDEYLAKEGEFLVGLVDDRLVAMGALQHKDQTTAIVRRMRVHPDYQRRGYGQQMLEALEAAARERNYSTLELDTTVLQTAAQRLYERNGYREVNRKMVRFETIFYKKRL